MDLHLVTRRLHLVTCGHHVDICDSIFYKSPCIIIIQSFTSVHDCIEIRTNTPFK